MHPVRPSPLGKKLRSLAPALWVALSPGLGHAQADPAAPDRPSGAGSQEAAPGTPAAPDPEGVKRVPYLPESLRAEIREQIRKDVLEQARKEGWAAPNAAPGWTKRLQFTGDVRARYEVIDFKRGNTTGWYWDFNAINGGKPLDMNAIDLTDDRWIDVDEDRSRSRLRARLGLEADLSQGFTAQLRLASGDGSSPVSTNQTLGGSTGSFGKYQLWVDRMALRYEAPKGGDRALTFQAGRFENPFFTTDLTWDEDVNLDGLAVQASFAALGTRPFFTAGAFPVFNTALDLAPELQEKFRSRDKWLYAAQLGDEWRPSERLGLKAGIAFYWFDRIEGRVGKDCDTNVSSSSCDTDSSRPSFAHMNRGQSPPLSALALMK